MNAKKIITWLLFIVGIFGVLASYFTIVAGIISGIVLVDAVLLAFVARGKTLR